jgi:hypothetical protein
VVSRYVVMVRVEEREEETNNERNYVGLASDQCMVARIVFHHAVYLWEVVG